MAYRGPVEYRIGTGWYGKSPKSFRKLAAAKRWAQAEANRTGKTVRIHKLWDVGEVDSYDIEPYKPSSRIGGEFNPRQRNAGPWSIRKTKKRLRHFTSPGGKLDVFKQRMKALKASKRNPTTAHRYTFKIYPRSSWVDLAIFRDGVNVENVDRIQGA